MVRLVQCRCKFERELICLRLLYGLWIAGLSDYEVRDLNDDINKLMREKRHWENQIVALGGANYRRNVAMTDDDGREVPGTKGYKYAHFLRSEDMSHLHCLR